MKIYLNQEWDKTWKWPIDDNEALPKSIDVPEEPLFKHLLQSPSSNIILISGARGSGKTTLVYKNLHDICQKGKTKYKLRGNWLDIFFKLEWKIKHRFTQPIAEVVVINTMQTVSKCTDVNQEVLRHIVRALYQQISKKDCRLKLTPELRDLYRKVNVTKYIHSELSEKKNLLDLVFPRSIISESFRSLPTLLGTVSWAGFYLFVKKYVPMLQDLSWIWLGLIPIVVGVAIWAIVKYILYLSTPKSSSVLLETSGLTLHELQYDLRQVLKKYKQTKFYFIFEELDHHDSESEKETGISRTQLLDSIKSIKVLASNLANCCFIFLVGPDTYKETERGGIPRFETVALSKIFLQPTKIGDLMRYLNEVFNISMLSGNYEDELKNFLYYIIFCSRCNFFKLKKEILHRIQLDEEGAQYIDTEILTARDKFTGKLMELVEFNYDRGDIEGDDYNMGSSLDYLFRAIDNYRSYALNSSTLPLQSPSTTSQPAAYSAFDDFIQSLGKLCGEAIATAPQNPVEPEVRDFTIDWMKISRSEISPSRLTGPVSKDEEEFYKLFQVAQRTFKRTGISIDPTNLKSPIASSIEEAINTYGIVPTSINPIRTFIEESDKIYGEIFTKKATKREAWLKDTLAVSGLTSIKSVGDWLRTNLPNLELGGLIFRMGEVYYAAQKKGVLEFYLREREHQQSVDYASLALAEFHRPAKEFHLNAKVTVDKEGVFDLLIGQSPYHGITTDDDYHMVRLDARSGAADGILSKPASSEKWSLDPTDTAKENTTADKEISLSVHRKNKVLKFEKNGSLIIKKNNVGPVYWIGFASEIKGAHIVIENRHLKGLLKYTTPDLSEPPPEKKA